MHVLELKFDEDKVTLLSERPKKTDYSQIDQKVSSVGGTSLSKERFLGEISKDDKIIRITSKHILMLNQNRDIEKVFENRYIQNFIFVDGSWIYALQDPALDYDNKLDR